MPTNLLRIAICLAMTIATLAVSGQNSELVNRSYDPQSDSVFFVKTHQYFEKIRQTEHRPTVAVVLAGGGARGTAHIGVLRYLEEKGIPIDFVAGTSMGGLMGGLYAMGYSVDEIDQLIRNIDWDVMMSDNIPMEYYTYDQKRYKSTYILDFPFDKEKFSKSLPSGIKYGLNIYNLMSSMTVGYQGDLDFMYLPTPFCCVASEIVTQTEKHWTSGSLITALRSTMSIPGYFRAVRADSMILADGGTKNNFPVDVAKAAGADIIIGVELYMPRDYSKVNTIADVLMQTTQYSGSLEAHNRNVKNSTVYITPDLSGYTSLSFSTEDINKMIQIGYDATVVHEREIDSLVRIVGSGGRKVQNAKALDISKTKVKISAVEYNGISEKEMRYFKDKIHITPGKYYDKEDIELEQATIYGTMAFSLVTYELLGEPDGTSYRLVFNCEKKPTNALGIGVRADSEEWIAILLNAGFGRNKIYGSVFDVTARLSIAPYLKLDWHYTPIVGPMFGASLKSQYRSLNGAYSFTLDMFSDDINENDDESYQYYEKTWRNILDIYVADTHWSRINLRAGFRFEQTPYVNSFTALGHYKGWHWTPIYPYLYLQFAYDNLSDRYFPNTGVRVTASYDYNFKNAHFAAASVQGAIPVCSFFHIIPALRNRFVFGLDGNEYMGNYVGGVMEGRYFDQQMPFIGFNGVTICNDFLTVVDVDFRFKIIKNLYLSLVAAAMHDGFLQENHLTGGSALRMNKHAIYAAGLKVAYKTKFGPLQANMHWNSKDKKSVGFYVSAGYDF